MVLQYYFFYSFVTIWFRMAATKDEHMQTANWYIYPLRVFGLTFALMLVDGSISIYLCASAPAERKHMNWQLNKACSTCEDLKLCEVCADERTRLCVRVCVWMCQCQCQRLCACTTLVIQLNTHQVIYYCECAYIRVECRSVSDAI